MLTLYTFTEGANDMAKSGRKRKSVDWDALELQAFDLRFERMSAEDQIRKARRLATTFRRHNQPLPRDLAALIGSRAPARGSVARNGHTSSYAHRVWSSLMGRGRGKVQGRG